MKRNVWVAGLVVVLHGVALWALQNLLLHQAITVVVQARLLSEFVSPSPPSPPTAQPSEKPVARPHPPTSRRPPTPLATPDPPPVAVAAAPAPAAENSLTLAPAPSAQPIATAPPAVAVPKLELPVSNADYLNNPRPSYPALSKRMGEHGEVVLRVLIGMDGTAHKAEIRTSSGFDRLDQAALATVLKWRYVPGKRGGVPEAMWFNVPIQFVLE